MSGTLYMVGTPIGNLGDFSPRAAETLEDVDFIAAEDTRVTMKLLTHFNIKKPLVSYYEHNKRERGGEIISRLEAGESCALVTDAGMPVFSDPGEELVAACNERGITVRVVPGPCAAVSALAAAGLPCGRFCFEGFLSVNKKSRDEHLGSIADEERTLVFYEAPHKLRRTLKDLYKAFGERRIALVRELTKIHEETVVTTLSKAAVMFDGEGGDARSPRGEYVLVVEGARHEKKELSPEDAMESAAQLVKSFVKDGLPRSEAVKKAAAQTGVSRSELYRRSLKD
jgi:16S rRNA (cytidine1402-2'-O)-methyltransferase